MAAIAQCLPNTAIELASYGLMVNTEGLLQSVANESSPAWQVNAVIEPDGDTRLRNPSAIRRAARCHTASTPRC